MPRLLIRLTTAALAALAIAPAAASALSATVDKPCYSRIPSQGSEPVIVNITGGTPGADFLVTAAGPGKSAGSSGSTRGTFDEAGNALAQIDNVSPPSGSFGPMAGQTIRLAVTDYGLGVDAAPVPVATTKVTNLSIDVAGKPTDPRLKRRVQVSGTPFAGKRLFGFVTTRTGSKILRRFPLGKGNVCGYTSDRDVIAPVNYRSGEYLLWVNAGRKLRKNRAISFSFRLFTTAG